MAKYPESYHQKPVKSYRNCKLTEYIQIINARGLYEFLMAEGRELYREGGNSPRFRDAVLTNLLHTSIVSGFADGSGQLAIGHATYDYMRTYNTENSLAFLHGELVAVGLLIQMYFNHDTQEEIDAVHDLMRDLEMPLTLKDVNYDISEESLHRLADAIMRGCNVTSAEEKDTLWQAVCKVAGA